VELDVERDHLPATADEVAGLVVLELEEEEPFAVGRELLPVPGLRQDHRLAHQADGIGCSHPPSPGPLYSVRRSPVRRASPAAEVLCNSSWTPDRCPRGTPLGRSRARP